MGVLKTPAVTVVDLKPYWAKSSSYPTIFDVADVEVTNPSFLSSCVPFLFPLFNFKTLNEAEC